MLVRYRLKLWTIDEWIWVKCNVTFIIQFNCLFIENLIEDAIILSIVAACLKIDAVVDGLALSPIGC